MITIYTTDEARQTILRREGALSPELSAPLRARMIALFGAPGGTITI